MLFAVLFVVGLNPVAMPRRGRAIESMGFDVYFDGAWRLIADAALVRHAAAKIRAADADDRHFHLGLPYLFEPLGTDQVPEQVDIWVRCAGTAHDDWNCQSANLLRVAPVGQVVKAVGPQQEKQFGMGQLLTNSTERIDGITDTATIDFKRADRQCGMTANGQLKHLDPLLFGGERLPALVWWHGGGEQPDTVQAALLPTRFGEQQMAVMNRIE